MTLAKRLVLDKNQRRRKMLRTSNTERSMSSGVTHCVLRPPFGVPALVRGGGVGGAEGIGASPSPLGEEKNSSRPPQERGLEEMVVVRGREAMGQHLLTPLDKCDMLILLGAGQLVDTLPGQFE